MPTFIQVLSNTSCAMLLLLSPGYHGENLPDPKFEKPLLIYLQYGHTKNHSLIENTAEVSFKEALEEAGATVLLTEDISTIPAANWGVTMTVIDSYLDPFDPPDSSDIRSVCIIKASVTISVDVQHNRKTLFQKAYKNDIYSSRNYRSTSASIRSVSRSATMLCIEDLVGLMRPSRKKVPKEAAKEEG